MDNFILEVFNEDFTQRELRLSPDDANRLEKAGLQVIPMDFPPDPDGKRWYFVSLIDRGGAVNEQTN